MRVLVLTPSYPPMIGGGEQYAAQLVNQFVERGHEITVITSDARRQADFWLGTLAHADETPAETPAVTRPRSGLEVIRCPVAAMPGGRAGLMAWRKTMVALSATTRRTALLQRMARRLPHLVGLEAVLNNVAPPDLVHAYNVSWEQSIVAGWEYARQRDIAYVVTPFAHLGRGMRDRVARNHTMAHQLQILSSADRILALTVAEADGLGDYGVPLERIRVVGAGLEPPAPPDAATVKATLSTHGIVEPVVLFVGRASRDKGAHHAIEAVKRLDGAGVACSLVIAGQADREIKGLCRRESDSAQGRIHCLGPVDEGTKQALLAASRVLVLPSRVESFGIVLLEAWSHGVPVIGANAGGIPGVVHPGADGLLVEYGDVRALAEAIATLLSDRRLAKRLGERGRQRVRTEYTWDAVYRRVASAYGEARRTHSASQYPV